MNSELRYTLCRTSGALVIPEFLTNHQIGEFPAVGARGKEFWITDPFRDEDDDGAEMVNPQDRGFGRETVDGDEKWVIEHERGTYLLTGRVGFGAPGSDDDGWQLACYPQGYDDGMGDCAWELTVEADGSAELIIYAIEGPDAVGLLRDCCVALSDAVDGFARDAHGPAEAFNEQLADLVGQAALARQTASFFWGWE